MCKEKQIHATMVVYEGQGIVLKGPSGCGKSDLALRLIENKAVRLVADDIVILNKEGDVVYGTAPEVLKGLLEVRGVGIVQYQYQERAPVRLVVELAVAAEQIDRMPKNEYENILGVEIPKIDLYARENSAPEKVLLKLMGNIVSDVAI